jgi:hypothetical protein
MGRATREETSWIGGWVWLTVAACGGTRRVMSKRRYEARCHCGRLRWAFHSEEITAGRRCNCSICIRKGAVMSTQYIPSADFEPIPEASMSEVSDYRWGDRDVNHLFCKTCGIYPYHGGPEWGYRVNLGCVEGLDALALEVGIIDGRAL